MAVTIMTTGCAEFGLSTPEAPRETRSAPPANHQSTITTYFDLTRKKVDPYRELAFGAPQRGKCLLAGNTLGWVVPVEYKTRSKDSSKVTITTYFFWFSDELLQGVSRRMELCP